MTEAAESGTDTCCLFINNGDDLLSLKKVISKKTDEDGEKQKLNKSIQSDDSELKGNHCKTDSINFEVNNTSSLEPNFEMDSVRDRNITIGSICTQEDRESEIIYTSNDNSNEANVNNGEKDIQVKSIKCLDVQHSQSDSLYVNDSPELEDDYSELNNIGSSVSYFNLSARAPLHSSKVLDSTFEGDNFLLEKEVLNNERKRKFEDLAEQDQKSTKILKMEITVENENTIEPESAVCENNSDDAKTEEKNTQKNAEADEKIEYTSKNVNKRNFCNIM